MWQALDASHLTVRAIFDLHMKSVMEGCFYKVAW